jgi:hypothetical protein
MLCCADVVEDTFQQLPASVFLNGPEIQPEGDEDMLSAYAS